MEIWIPGVLALVGALAGVLLSSVLTRRSKRDDARRQRLEDALRAVSLAIAAQHVATSIGIDGKPKSVDDSHVAELERKAYLNHVEALFTTLWDARRAVAMLAADGIDLGDSWRGDEEMQADLESVYERLREELRRR